MQNRFCLLASAIALVVSLTACPELFVVKTFSLKVTPSSGGSVLESSQQIQCSPKCSASFTQNTQVSLQAIPKAQFIFSSWTGDCAGQTNPCILTITSDKTVGSEFLAVNGSFSPVLETPDPILSEASSTKLELQVNPDAGFNVPISAFEVSASGKYLGNSDVLVQVRVLPAESTADHLMLEFQTPKLDSTTSVTFAAALVVQVGQDRKTLPMVITVVPCPTCTGGQP